MRTLTPILIGCNGWPHCMVGPSLNVFPLPSVTVTKGREQGWVSLQLVLLVVATNCWWLIRDAFVVVSNSRSGFRRRVAGWAALLAVFVDGVSIRETDSFPSLAPCEVDAKGAGVCVWNEQRWMGWWWRWRAGGMVNGGSGVSIRDVNACSKIQHTQKCKTQTTRG